MKDAHIDYRTVEGRELEIGCFFALNEYVSLLSHADLIACDRHALEIFSNVFVRGMSDFSF